MNNIKRVFFLVVVLFFISSCKEKKDEEKAKPSVIAEIDEKTDKKEEQKVLNFESFLELKNKPNEIIINKQLTDDLFVEKLACFRDPNNKYHFLFQIKGDESNIDNYKINLKIKPFSNEIKYLREDTKNNKLLLDSWFANLILKKGNGKKYIYFPVETQMSSFDLIEVRSYDNDKKKYIGNKITIKYDFEKFIVSNDEKNLHNLDQNLGENLFIEKLNIFKKVDTNDLTFLLKINNTPEGFFKDKKLIFKLFPKEEFKSLLRKESLSKNLDYDTWYFDVNMRDDFFIATKVPTEILEFKKIEINLFDKIDKKYAGPSIVIKDVSVEYN